MKILCEVCFFQCSTFTQWSDHLLSKGHQMKTLPNLLSWTEEMNERSVHIKHSNFRNDMPNLNSCIKYLSSFGLITDCVFDSGLKYVIIQFDTFAGIDYIHGKKPHFIDKIPVTIRTLCHLTSRDRQALVPISPYICQVKMTPEQNVNPVVHIPIPILETSHSAESTRLPYLLNENIKIESQIPKGNPFLAKSLPVPVLDNVNMSIVKTAIIPTLGSDSFSNKITPASPKDMKSIQTVQFNPFSEATLHVHEPLIIPPLKKEDSNILDQAPPILNTTSANLPNLNKLNASLSTIQPENNNLGRSAKQAQVTSREHLEPVVDNIFRNMNTEVQKTPSEKDYCTDEGDTFFDRHDWMMSKCSEFDLERQLEFFMTEITMDTEQISTRHDFLYELSELIKYVFSSATLYPFGSFITNLGDKDSDIDIFVDALGSCLSHGYVPSKEEKSQIFYRILRHLRKQGQLFSLVIGVAQARVPIIKLVHRKTKIKVDFSFENLLSVQNSKLVAFYINFDHRVRPLLLIVRYWARFHGLSGCNLIKNYGLVLLVLVFLMKKGIIPSVQILQALAKTPLLIGNWNAAYCDNAEYVAKYPVFSKVRALPFVANNNGFPTAITNLRLAQEFFHMFANLDYEDQVVCTLIGDFLPRKCFTPGFEAELPPGFDRYHKWISEQETNEGLDIKKPLCIQDPFNLSFNVGGCTKETLLLKFRAACVGILAELTNTLNSGFPILMNIFQPLAPELGQKLSKAQRKRLNTIRSNNMAMDVGILITEISPAKIIRNPQTEVVIFTRNIEYETFVRTFTKKLAPEPYLENLSATLWRSYMSDFLKTVFTEAYLLDVQIENFNKTTKTQSQDVSSTGTNNDHSSKLIQEPKSDVYGLRLPMGRGRRNPKRQLWSSPEFDKNSPGNHTNGESGYKFLKPGIMTPPFDKEAKVELKAERNPSFEFGDFCKNDSVFQFGTVSTNNIENEMFLIHCTGTFEVWQGRRVLRKNISEQMSSKIDPLLTEKELTKLVLQKLHGDEFPKDPLYKFDIQVHYEEMVNGPTFRVIFTEVLIPGLKLNKQSLAFFTGMTLKSLSLQYVKYRFNEWFSLKGGKDKIVADQKTLFTIF